MFCWLFRSLGLSLSSRVGGKALLAGESRAIRGEGFAVGMHVFIEGNLCSVALGFLVELRND
jgi:hypothetical protein